jgi:hypothetical protein
LNQKAKHILFPQVDSPLTEYETLLEYFKNGLMMTVEKTFGYYQLSHSPQPDVAH